MPAHAMPKEKKGFKGKFLIILLVLLIGVLGFSVYKVLSTYFMQQQEQQRFTELRELIGEDETQSSSESPSEVFKSKYDKLFAMNSDMRGWLKVEDTAIDYPVMKNDDDNGEYYLHRDFDGEYSFAGCLFIGMGSDYDSDIFIIYGHNMRNGTMFGGLSKYYDKDYAVKHQLLQFDTRTERRVYQVFAAFQSKAFTEEDEVFKYYEHVGNYDQEAYEDILDRYRDMAVVWMDEQPQYPDQIMLLSTCADYTENGRFIVAAYRIK